MKALKNTAVFEGLTERDLVALYGATSSKQYETGDHLISAAERSDSHYLVVQGRISVFSGTDTPRRLAATFSAGQCIGPFGSVSDSRFWLEAGEPASVIQVKPAILNCLPDKLQIWIYKNACRPVFEAAGNSDKAHGLAAYIRYQAARSAEVCNSDFIKNFISTLPKLPPNTVELSSTLLSDTASVQEVVEAVKRDPALAGTVLKCVNSAQYAFQKKIETFYHACMILGFNNIYRLLMQEGIRNAMPACEEGCQIHLHSCLISALCYEVASVSKEVHPQTAITIGLLHDLGKNAIILLKQKHPDVASFTPLIDSARVGAELVRQWGLPERLCQAIEFQNFPEFLAPDEIDATYRKEAAVLYLAHIFEGLMTGKAVDAARQTFLNEHVEALGIGSTDISKIYQTKIMPGLMKNRQRLPVEIRQLLPTI